MKQENNWKTRTLLIGAMIGLFTGLGASYILINQAEKEAKQPDVTPSDGVKLGLGVFTLLRLVSDLSRKN